MRVLNPRQSPIHDPATNANLNRRPRVPPFRNGGDQRRACMSRARYQTPDMLNYIPREQRVWHRTEQLCPRGCNERAGQPLQGAEIERAIDLPRPFAAARHQCLCEIARGFALGGTVQLTAPNRDLQGARRDLGMSKSFDPNRRITLSMDSGKEGCLVRSQ